jgi:short-subunit dehydrogenase
MSRTVVITGASSGIGHALAIEYAKHGDRLALLGRDRGRLEKTAAACRGFGAEVSIGAIDVRDRGAMHDYLVALDARSPVDLLIANAGILRGSPDGTALESTDDGFAVLETNVIGLANTIHPLLPRMIARGRGNIALMSSTAGFAPLPHMPAYSASKSAVLTYGLALRAALRSQGIGVSVICPAFIDTPMTAQIRGSTPFLMAAEEAARRIRQGLERNRAVIAFPWFLAILTRIDGALPDWARRLTAYFARFSVTEGT